MAALVIGHIPPGTLEMEAARGDELFKRALALPAGAHWQIRKLLPGFGDLSALSTLVFINGHNTNLFSIISLNINTFSHMSKKIITDYAAR